VSIGPPNLASTVARFAFPVTRIRYDAAAEDDSGLVTRGDGTSSTIEAHVHDAPAKAIERLPEGHSSGRVVQGYTTDDVRTADSDTGTPADDVVFEGTTFEVALVTEWSSGPVGSRTWREFLAQEVTR
jgi:hypothetical protein